MAKKVEHAFYRNSINKITYQFSTNHQISFIQMLRYDAILPHVLNSVWCSLQVHKKVCLDVITFLIEIMVKITACLYIPCNLSHRIMTKIMVKITACLYIPCNLSHRIMTKTAENLHVPAMIFVRKLSMPFTETL
jgi:hypothetical protein